MIVIAVANEKGGVGKTTLTVNLANEVHRCGYGSSAIIDADPSGAASEWYNRRSPDIPGPVFLDVGPAGLAVALEAAEKGGIKVIFVDTPGEASIAIQQIFEFCDLVLIPFKASTVDMSMIGKTMDRIEAAGRPFRFVINESKRSSVLSALTMSALSTHAPVLSTIIETREIFRMCGEKGLTVSEMKGAPAKAAAEQIASLWRDISSYLDNLKAGKGGRRGSSKTT